MSRIEDLRKSVETSRLARVEEGSVGLPKIVVSSDLASAEVYLHGAHVTNFQPRGTAPLLFMSEASLFQEGKPIRGGIPLVFPWFGPLESHPEAPPHGFARTRSWQIESCEARTDDSVRIVLTLTSDQATLQQWPNTFSLRLIILVSNVLDMTLEVKNTSNVEYRFEEAMHTYLAVGDVRSITIDGLGGVEYLDRADNGARKKQGGAPIYIAGETDRLYLNTTGRVTVHDPEMGRTIFVEKEGSNATVVWNPWIEKARAMADLGDGKWTPMVCVETANARDCAVTLGPGRTHRMTSRIGVAV
jgi:glucose-6-phosphate 1-epimerase